MQTTGTIYFAGVRNQQFLDGSIRDSLVRVKTPLGTPHLAFASRALAQDYIARRNLKEISVISTDEITPVTDCNFDRGVLFVSDRLVLDAMVEQSQSFNYKRHMIRFNLPAVRRENES